jgi:hypothetical protein
VVTNPPWLALSKIASNPYQNALKAKSEIHGIKAPGSSHLHVEIATIFLLHAIDRYLTPGAVIGCILPDTVLNGSHHEPFRSAGYLTANKPVQFAPGEIWKIANQTFKNEAIVLFGSKSQHSGATTFVGRDVSRTSETVTTYHIVKSNGRTAWTTTPPAIPAVKVTTKKSIGPLFRQGADMMPRGIVFHASVKNGGNWNLGPINAGSPFYFLRSDGHRLKDFALNAIGVSDQVMFDVLISKHLAPYELAAGAKGLLPFQYGTDGWEPRTGPGIAALGGATSGAIKTALTAINESIDEFFETVDTDRKKLSSQGWAGQDWVVVASAGGKLPCAAYVRGDQIPCGKTVIDQTLYWGRVATEDEAIYITALINSKAVIEVIKAHQPRGAFGERHIHKLAFDRTPVFDSSNPDHRAVVDTAKALLSEWATRRKQPDMQPMLSPQKHMITRRTKIRAALEQLPGWDAYQTACANLYGV